MTKELVWKHSKFNEMNIHATTGNSGTSTTQKKTG